MESKAIVKFASFSPKKVQQVLELIRRKPVVDAFRILKFVPKSATSLVSKALRSAVANGKRLNNQEGLRVKECWVNQGPALKRFRAASFGRATLFKHKTCHLTIIISD
jgi:large subunit ribosomal protein L22